MEHPCDLLAKSRALETGTQLALAVKLSEAFPQLYPKEKAGHQIISKWETDRDWRPRSATWNRLRAVLRTLPPLPRD